MSLPACLPLWRDLQPAGPEMGDNRPRTCHARNDAIDPLQTNAASGCRNALAPSVQASDRRRAFDFYGLKGRGP
jgi:hypothetical protein